MVARACVRRYCRAVLARSLPPAAGHGRVQVGRFEQQATSSSGNRVPAVDSGRDPAKSAWADIRRQQATQVRPSLYFQLQVSTVVPFGLRR